MKIKDVMKVIEKLNELRNVLDLEKAYVSIWIDNQQIGDEFYTLNDLVLAVKNEYIADFWRKLLDIEYTKTYNNTLSAEIKWISCTGREFISKVELFVDC